MFDKLRLGASPEGLTDAQERLALGLHDAGLIYLDFDKGFLLKSGLVTPIYIDLRLLQSFPDLMDEAVGALIAKVKDLEFDRVVGIPKAAEPIAALVANRLRKPQITLRMDSKIHGMPRSIDGVFSPGETVLAIDDLVTKGDSKFEVINILKEKGLLVRDIGVVIDRQQGGGQQLAEKGLTLHAALKIKPALQLYERVGKITHEEFAKLMQ